MAAMLAVPGLALALTGGNGRTALAAPESRPAESRTLEERATARLQGLDKVTARVWNFSAPLHQSMPFGTLTVTVRACRVTPPIEPPEAAAFLEILENRSGEDARTLFSGWMFASSPALSALEHPVYDVWVTGCGDS